ncbi:MAG: DUF2842 domain-containing protein [Rhodospirillaceae bacterium]|nr:DUF2842 domain-containing protein [Rhodospirillaceae bacterium]
MRTTPFRWRGVVCGLAIVAGLAVYGVLVATVSLWVPRHWAAELAFYLVAGLSWIWPAARLIAWAGRDNGARR